MQTCPLIDYLAWVPFTLAVVVAGVVAAGGVVRRDQALLGHAINAGVVTIVGTSPLAAIAILAVKGSC